MRARIVTLAALLALGAAGAALASGWNWHVPSRAKSNLAAARRDAHALIGKLVLPAGAVPVSRNPSDNAWLNHPQMAQDTPALVDVHRFYRVTGERPDTVARWFQSHVPAGSSLDGTVGGSGDYSGYSYAFPSETGVLEYRQLSVAIVPARGGGTAVRVDAEDIYWVPRPKSERVPTGARSIDVTVKRMNPFSTSHLTVTDRTEVAKVVRLVNALAPAQPGVSSCPGDDGPYVTLSFLAGDGKALAQAVVDGSGCGGVSFSLGGRQRAGLSGGWTLDEQLERLLGFKG